MTPEDKERLESLRRLKKLRAAYGIYAYRPHSKQSLFHAAAKHKRRYLRTGNRFGKSTCGAAEDCAFALGARLWLPENDPVRHLGIPRRSTKGVILVADWDKAREIFTSQEEGQGQGKLMKLIPKERIHHLHKNQAGEIDTIEVKNIYDGVSTISLDTVKSFMANPMAQESSQWDWIHVDEPIPKKMWEANARGLIDTGGSAWFTCTPIAEQWINEYFLPVKMMKSSFENGFSWEQYPERWIMTGSSYDNTTIAKENIDQFANDLTETERLSRIFGLPKSSQGLVYPEFDQEKHVYTELPKGWKDYDEPPDNYTIRVFIDPHPRTPHAVQFWATAPTGQAFCYYEIFSACYINDLCRIIQSTLKGRVPWQICIDPIAFIPNPIDGTCYADVFVQNGLNVMPAPKELSTGIQKAKQELVKEKNVYFCSSCSETIREFYTYVWDKEKEKPVDKDDHMMECFYRACVVGLDWINVEKQVLREEQLRSLDMSMDLTPLSGSSLSKLIG